MADPTLKLYGAAWCMKSAKLRNYLQSKWIDFEDFDVEEDEAANQTVRALYDGELKFPTLTYGELFFKNPSLDELDRIIKDNQLSD